MRGKHLSLALEKIAHHDIPGNINLWPEILAKLEKRSTRKYSFPRSVVSFLTAVLVFLGLSGVVYALGAAFGYLPGIGLVDNSIGLRMLAEPVALTREGVTLTISSVLVYEDRVELIYDVDGIAPENDGSLSGDIVNSPADYCGGQEIGEYANADDNVRLQLPDGTFLKRDTSGAYSQNVFAMKPVFSAVVSSDITHMTFLLDCIPFARLGEVPEDWSIPFDLITVPPGTSVGVPVIEVDAEPGEVSQDMTSIQSDERLNMTILDNESMSNIATSEVTMKLTKIVPLETQTVFYFSLDMKDRDPSLISIMPQTAYVIDSQGQRIQLIGAFSWQAFEHRVGSEFEFISQSKPADGPLTLVVENAVAYYAPLYSDPPQALPQEMTFSFDAGDDPKYGQTWDLDAAFEIGGYPVRISSVRAARFEDLDTEHYIDGSQGYEFGYDFTIETDQPVNIMARMDIVAQTPLCGLDNVNLLIPESSSLHYIQLCRDRYPSGIIIVIFSQLSVLIEGTWQDSWIP